MSLVMYRNLICRFPIHSNMAQGGFVGDYISWKGQKLSILHDWLYIPKRCYFCYLIIYSIDYKKIIHLGNRIREVMRVTLIDFVCYLFCYFCYHFVCHKGGTKTNSGTTGARDCGEKAFGQLGWLRQTFKADSRFWKLFAKTKRRSYFCSKCV